MLKYITIHIVRFLLTVFCIFPVNKKKIFFSSFNGKRCFCNPKYIFLDMYSKLPEIKYVWCINQDSPELSKYTDVITVKFKTILWFFHILTAKIVITNQSLSTFLPYRKNQIIINTWHGGGAYKRVGFSDTSISSKKYWAKKIRGKFFVLVNKSITYFISSSKVFSDIMHESFRIPYNNYLTIGMPRNDIFFKNNNDFVVLLKSKFDISFNLGIVLYAPTFRSAHSNSETQAIIEKIDINKLKIVLKNKFDKDFVCLFKGHPSVPNDLCCDDTINVSAYNDIQELLLITDVLITDYSSSIWDFSLTLKPGFLFTPDLDLYLSKDKGFFSPIEEWPYPFARTNDELCNNIINFDQTEQKAKIKKHHEDLGSYEQGTATSKVTELLQEIFE